MRNQPKVLAGRILYLQKTVENKKIVHITPNNNCYQKGGKNSESVQHRKTRRAVLGCTA